MKNVSIDSPVAQKIAAALVTKKLRDKYNLHVQMNVKELGEEAQRLGITAQELFCFLENKLPVLVREYLDELNKVIN